MRVGHQENLATESLAYILDHSRAARRALVRFIRQLGVNVSEDLTFRSQQGGVDGSIPDLVGANADEKEPFVLEAKFWAGLTDNQPVAYLTRITQGSDGVLLVVAPALRFSTLWPELVMRCQAANVALGGEKQVSPELKFRPLSPHHVLAITSWRALLSHLLQALEAEGDSAGVSDVKQLQGLCDRMDDDAFLPLQSEELTSSLGARMIQFCRLVDEVATQTVTEGLAAPYGRVSSGPGSYFRPLTVQGFGCYLQVNSELWARRWPTPIWLGVWDAQWKLTEKVRQALAPLQLRDPPRAFEGPQEFLVPLNLPLAVERSVIVEALLAQLREVASLLAATSDAEQQR